MAAFTDDTGEYEHLYTEYEKKRFKRILISDFKEHPDEHIIKNPKYNFYTYTMKPITISGGLYIPSYMSKSYKNSIDEIKKIDPSGVFFADLSGVTDVEKDDTIINKIKNDVIESNRNSNEEEEEKMTSNDKNFPFHNRYKKVNSYKSTQIKPNDVNTIGNVILKLIELNENGIYLKIHLDLNEHIKIPLIGTYIKTTELNNKFDIYDNLISNNVYKNSTYLKDLFKLFDHINQVHISEDNTSNTSNKEQSPGHIFSFALKNDEIIEQEQKTKILKQRIKKLLKENEQQPKQQPEQHKPEPIPTTTTTSTPGGKDIPFTVSFDSDAKIVKVKINKETFGDGTYIVDPKNPKNKPKTSGGEIDKTYSFVYNTGDKSIKHDKSESTPEPLLLRSQPQPPITEQTNEMKNILNEYLKLFDVLEKRYTDIVEDTAKQNEEDVVKTVEDFSLVSHKINQVVFEDISNENNKVKELKEKYLNNQQEQTTTPPQTLPLPPTPPQQEQKNDLKGIVNIGNSCYINATIQFLINAGDSAINAANYNTDLHNFMKDYKNNKEDPITIGVYKLANVFNHNGSQQDASESVLIPFLNKKGEGFDTTVKITSTFNCNDDDKYNYSKPEVSDTILVLPINEDPTNLTTLIQSMSDPVELDGPTHTCQENFPDINIKTTKTDHYYFGDYAIIALNRFISDNTTSKNNNKVSIEKQLTLPINEQSEHEYKCISMINHSGSLNAGHYWANVVKYDISDKPQMYKCNDSSITEESIPNDKYIVENSPYVYIVLYEKIKDPIVDS